LEEKEQEMLGKKAACLRGSKEFCAAFLCGEIGKSFVESVGKRLDNELDWDFVFGKVIWKRKNEKCREVKAAVICVPEIRKTDLTGNSRFCVREVFGKRENEHVKNCVRKL
jgi:hypothetical protein